MVVASACLWVLRCWHVCVCVYTCVYVCKHVCIHVNSYKYTYTYTYTDIYTYIYVNLCIFNMYLLTYLCVCKYWVSFDFNVSYSSCWGYSLINTLKLKKIRTSYLEKMRTAMKIEPEDLPQTPVKWYSTRNKSMNIYASAYIRAFMYVHTIHMCRSSYNC